MVQVSRRVLNQLAITGLAGLVLPRAMAQEAFPTRPVRIIVPIPAGGATDVAARVLAKEFSQATKQAFLVENRPGGNNVIAAQAVISSPADGHTMMIGSNASMAANVPGFKNLGYDPIKDFTPVGMVVRAYWVLVVSSASPYATLEDLVAAARQRPGVLSAGEASSGFQLATALFARDAGIKLNDIPYKGTVPTLQDLMGRQIDLAIVDLSTALPLVQSGKLRALVGFADKRSAAMPDVPTLKEKGYASIPLHSWAGFFVRSETPAPVVAQLAALVKAAVGSDSYRKYIAEVNSEAVFESPGATLEFQKAQIEAYRQAMKVAGIEAQ